MAAWLLKTEPESYSLEDLERDGRTTWDGVTSSAALRNLRLMQVGECCFFYHTGKEKQIVGIAQVASPPYADPKASDDKLVVVDIAFDRRLKKPVTLAQIKADPLFADWVLVRQGRLSVVLTPPEIWKRVLELAGE
jgi:predicted RNA-binding protein with PUA-like domain